MSFAERFTQNFIDEQRYLYLVKGLGNTVLLQFLLYYWVFYWDF